MNYIETEVIEAQHIKITNHLNDLGIETVRKEIIEGLIANEKRISSKFFYDEKGSKLFEDITHLPEYYPTRTEISILEKIAPELMKDLKNIDLVELGSGDCSKISILIDSISSGNLETINYIPIDVSQSAIYDAAQILVERFPEISVNGLVSDFINQLDLIPKARKRMFFFLGSTLGNFTKSAADQFLSNLSSNMNPGDQFLLGVDLKKSENILHAAYNDKQNVTAQFNKNILNVVNDIIDSDFNSEDFEHSAFFNKEESRIEMHLIAKKDLIIHTPYSSSGISFKKNENIHTENSYKYTLNRMRDFESSTNLKIKQIYTDPNNWFALVLFQK